MIWNTRLKAGAGASPLRSLFSVTSTILTFGFYPDATNTCITDRSYMGTTDAQFEQVIDGFSKPVQSLARETRKLIHRILPEVVEVAWVQQKNIGFGTGIKKNTEHFCWLMPATKHVTLGFNYGAELPDPAQLLEGNGKLFRHIKISSAEQLKNSELLKLLRFSSTYRMPAVRRGV